MLIADDAVPAGLDGMVSLVCSLYETDTEAAPGRLTFQCLCVGNVMVVLVLVQSVYR